MPSRRWFDAQIVADGSNAYVDVPARIGAAYLSYAKARRISVAGKVRGVAFHGTLMPVRGGGHRLFLGRGTRDPAGIAVGDKVRVQLLPLREPGTDAPRDLVSGLRRVKGAEAAFNSLLPSHRGELIHYVEDSRTARTRQQRIKKIAGSVLGQLAQSQAPPKTKPMWTCPQCGEAFVNKNQRHSCRRYELDGVLGDKSESVQRCFARFQRMVLANGKAVTHIHRDKVTFKVRVRFAAATPKQKWLDVAFWLPHRVEHERLTKVETITPDAHVHRVRVADESQLDDVIADWLAESYAFGCQLT